MSVVVTGNLNSQ